VDRGAVGLLDFDLRTKCPKCWEVRFSWQYTAAEVHMQHTRSCPEVYGDKNGHIDLTCGRCGYTIGMKTADA